jgi:hypothetical protein
MGRLPCASRQALAIPAAAPTHPGLEGSCDPITSNLYDAAQEDEVPDTAIKASLGSRLPHPLPTRRLDPTGSGVGRITVPDAGEHRYDVTGFDPMAFGGHLRFKRVLAVGNVHKLVGS